MSKQTVMVLLAASMVTVTACSGTSGGPSATGSTEANSKPAVAADPFGKYEKPVTLNIAYSVDPSFKSSKGETPENNVWNKAIKESLNIDLKIAWQVAKTNFDQKMNLAIASNDLPDAMVVNQVQLNQMVKAGEIEDLTDAYNKYASPAVKRIVESTDGLAKSQVTFDGKIMAVPSVTAEDFSWLWIRKDWLDKLGLQPPKTMEDLENVAKAFVEQDPDGNGKADTIGLAAGTGLYNDFTQGPPNFDFTAIFSAYNAYPGFWVKGADGKPVYGSTMPEAKKALAKLRDMYAKGLIDKEIGIRKTPEEVVISGKAGMFFCGFYGGYWPLPSAWQNDPKANWQAYALPLGENGKYNVMTTNPTNTFLVVRKGYANPEAPIKINNFYLRDESKYGNEFMLIRNFFAPLDEIGFEMKAAKEVLAGAKKPEDYADNTEYKLLKNTLETIKNTKLQPYDNMDIQYWNMADKDFMRSYSLFVGGRNHFDPNVNKIKSLSYTRTQTMENKWTNLLKLEKESFLKIIMGSAPLDSFDQFVKDWQKQGGDQVTKEIEQTMK
ncbi:sugar ABC transporter substrate-binding protein [Paenibacillus elgii]|uniref:Sugar ABC transporter substrate-binding protein n=1 Tax=Paenibacillus elgii TaxID=189691 RepID=A0A163ZJS3_9BACL|nr:extracellular solute-binding protein [Paenibacillus elgii]KZE81908.1 sugar ABC transporter substrate-binding protein [Paenibacillus elgii]